MLPTAQLNILDMLEMAEIKDLLRAGNITAAMPRLYNLAVTYPQNQEMQNMIRYYTRPPQQQPVTYYQQPVYYQPQPLNKKSFPWWAWALLGVFVLAGIAAASGNQQTSTVSSKPAATATANLSPNEQAVALANSLFKGSTASVTAQNVLMINYQAGAAWDERALIKGVLYDIQSNTPQLFSKLPAIQGLAVVAFEDFTDARGNTTNEMAVSVQISRQTSATIKWPGVAVKNMDMIVDDFRVNDALDKAWGEIKQGK